MIQMDMPLAEKLGHYYETSRTSPDEWIDKTKRLIEKHGGRVTSWGFGERDGEQSAYLIAFEFEGNQFKVIWPVLPTSRSSRSARIQATTLMYHDIVSRLMNAKVHGVPFAFFQYLILPSGRTTVEEFGAQLNFQNPFSIAGTGSRNVSLDVTIVKSNKGET